jgi:hypothetical protein
MPLYFAQLLAEQVEYANVIILNKTDMVDEEQLEQVKEQLNLLNPRAKLLTSLHSKVSVFQFILRGPLFLFLFCARSEVCYVKEQLSIFNICFKHSLFFIRSLPHLNRSTRWRWSTPICTTPTTLKSITTCICYRILTLHSFVSYLPLPHLNRLT